MRVMLSFIQLWSYTGSAPSPKNAHTLFPLIDFFKYIISKFTAWKPYMSCLFKSVFPYLNVLKIISKTPH